MKPIDDNTIKALCHIVGAFVVRARRCTERTVIHTLEGDMVAEPGDWIITGVKG